MFKRSKNRIIIGPYNVIPTIFVLACILVGVLCFNYYSRLQDTIREESSGYLQEVSKRIGNNINRIISDNYAVLETMAAVLDNQNVESFSDVKAIAEIQKEYWNYKDIMLIDRNGVAYNSEGREIILNSNVYLQNAVINKEHSMSTSQMVGNEESVMFAIPVENMVIDGKSMVAVASSYDPTVFEQMLSMSAFEGKATSNIVGKDGTIIIRSSSENALKMGYNLLSTLEDADFENGKGIDTIKSDMIADRAAQVEFTYGGSENYLVYTPIEPEDWYLCTLVPVDVVNARSDMLLNVTLLLCGFITLAFAALITFLMFNFYRNKGRLERMAFVDEITNGNTIQKFYQLAAEALAVPGHPTYAMIYTNMEKFKVLNEQFGRRTCDTMLAAFCECISIDLTERECIGRQSADNFCVLLRYEGEEALLERFNSWYKNGEEFVLVNKSTWLLPITEFGIMVIEDDTMPFPQMIDRAKLSLRKSVHVMNDRIRYAFYDDELRRRLLREKQLEDMTENAMTQREFKVFLQPKYRVSDERIGGAEALSRWVSNSEGMIFPDEFIPLFEQNGYIVRLDLWVFEDVCRTIRRWLDEGKQPVRISVNCSRVHLRDPKFLNPYIALAEKYQVPREFLEIELTESVVMENTELLNKTIDQIHEAGFACSMDDFGSGYSSLNLIQSIPVDTLKLDKIFFKNKDEEKAESVVGGITMMARSLSMETVAEGVEYREQVDMLRRVGCNYIQGYVFAKPMPIPEFEKLLFEESEKTSS